MEFEFDFVSVQNWVRQEYVSLIYLIRKYAEGFFFCDLRKNKN
jgi:hypothetical protein